MINPLMVDVYGYIDVVVIIDENNCWECTCAISVVYISKSSRYL